MIKRLLGRNTSESFDSANYWESRYKSGGNSGEGSYDRYAEFKADVINEFLGEKNITRAIEFGCGDGNQASLINYKEYIGLDVSETIVQKCIRKFQSDKNKSFFLYRGNAFSDPLGVFRCDLSLSLDVLYHLIEKDVYLEYIKNLFSVSNKYVVIYSSNINVPQRSHELHREFLKDVEYLFKDKWVIENTIINKYPAKNIDDLSGSMANFYFFRKNPA